MSQIGVENKKCLKPPPTSFTNGSPEKSTTHNYQKEMNRTCKLKQSLSGEPFVKLWGCTSETSNPVSKKKYGTLDIPMFSDPATFLANPSTKKPRKTVGRFPRFHSPWTGQLSLLLQWPPGCDCLQRCIKCQKSREKPRGKQENILVKWGHDSISTKWTMKKKPGGIGNPKAVEWCLLERTIYTWLIVGLGPGGLGFESGALK